MAWKVAAERGLVNSSPGAPARRRRRTGAGRWPPGTPREALRVGGDFARARLYLSASSGSGHDIRLRDRGRRLEFDFF